ncbi:MAG TPA: thiol:disulfide interchange protein DsbA/DsbL [Paucimonas sp.]|nr:thiol:disulfide interchange protein DsbA/DsbL [Paucimonas sp.]
MRILQRICVAAGMALCALTAAATPANPQNGADYLTLPEAQQTDSGNKVEVVEFFSYACPHCAAFEPQLAEWVKKQGGRIAFKRVPLAYRAQWVPLQKMYYALEALGKTEEVHARIFHAVHRERAPYDNDSAMIELAVKLGIDRKQFTEAYNSFGVQSKVRRTGQLQEAYRVTGVPMLAIDGRYETSPGFLADNGLRQPEEQLFASALQVADFLVTKAGKR